MEEKQRTWFRLPFLVLLVLLLALCRRGFVPAEAAADGPASLTAPPPKAHPGAPKVSPKPKAPVEAPPPKPAASPPPKHSAAAPPKSSAAAPSPKEPVVAPPPKITAAPSPKAHPISPTPKATPIASPPARPATKPKPSEAAPPPAPPPDSSASPSPSPSPSVSPLAAPAPKSASGGKAKPHVSPPPKHSPLHPVKKTPAPESAPPPLELSPSSSPSDSGSLNAKQLSALRALGVKYNPADPCKSRGNDILCNKAGTTILGLTVRNCSRTAELTLTVLDNLAGVQVLQFVDCPLVPPSHVPHALVRTLTAFYCTESLGRTGINERLPRLKAKWLAQLVNLNDILVTEVDVSGKGLYPITERLSGLTNLTISKASIGGLLPKNTWPPAIEYIDVSSNQIRGTIPKQMRQLTTLKHLDLSTNQLTGVIPNIFDTLNKLQHVDLHGNQLSGPIPGSLVDLYNCSYLDLSNNKLNGSIPANLTEMRALRHLDLSQNEFTGEIKFNSSFLKRLKVLKIAPNPNLCYNHSAIKSTLLKGIKNCLVPVDDNYFAPAPAPSMLEDLKVRSGGGGGLSKGAAAGISIVVILAVIIIFFIGRRVYRARRSNDEFISMRP